MKLFMGSRIYTANLSRPIVAGIRIGRALIKKTPSSCIIRQESVFMYFLFSSLTFSNSVVLKT